MISLKSAFRIRKNLHSDNLTPVSMQINITGRCPLHCWHCEKSVNREGKDLDWNILKTWLDQAVHWKCPVLFTGGEPLVFRGWRNLLAEGAERKLSQKLITSGITFPSFTSQDRILLRDSLDELLISVDSAESSIHDKLRGRSGLLDGIRDYLSQGTRPETTWLVHVPAPDFSSVEPVLRLAAEYSVGVLIQPFIFVSNFPDLPVLESKEDIRRQLVETSSTISHTANELTLLAKELQIVSNLEEVSLFVGDYYHSIATDGWYGKSVLPKFVCSIPWQQVTVDEFGNLQPCVFLNSEIESEAATPAAQWQRQALNYRKAQLGGKLWPECHSCTCHFGSNFRNSLLMFPRDNHQGWGIAIRKKLSSIRFQRHIRGES